MGGNVITISQGERMLFPRCQPENKAAIGGTGFRP